MQIERGRTSEFLLSLLGKRLRGLRLSETGVVVFGPHQRHLNYLEIAGPAEVNNGFPYSSISLSLIDGSMAQVSGFNSATVNAFVAALNAKWRSVIGAQIATHASEIERLFPVVERLRQPRRYPAACLLEPYRANIETLLGVIPWRLSEEMVPADHTTRALGQLKAFHRSSCRLREQAIDLFIEAELREMKDFFDSVETKPLTFEQRTAIVTDEDATLVLAGAGSGKTSVITAKAVYLIDRGIRQPEEILLMAFGKNAAAEMAERIEQRCGAPVAAKTFHALAYGIIGEVESGAPALADHATDEVLFFKLLRDILLDLANKMAKLAVAVIVWFSELFRPLRTIWDFKNWHEYYTYIEEQELRTLQGDLVRSFEELQIANWLYLNGIAYEYEPVYEHPLPESERRAYTPDFRLTESGVYIEHFGVRKTLGPDNSEQFTTAPYIDRNSYLEDMAWKRQVHAAYGTTLIETYSYEQVEGRLTTALAEKLKPYVTCRLRPREAVFEKLRELGQIDTFTRLLGTFLRHFKGSGRAIDDCRKCSEGLETASRQRGHAFLDIFEPVFTEYQKRLEPRIDFEDMIARATAHVRSGRYRSPYRHLLVDEFQDISQDRASLLRALKAQHVDARIFAVGDDWQSIYRFTGSDIGLMRNFGQEFGGAFADTTGVHRTVDLGRTFRSVDRIALPARSFVLKNPSQIRKTVIPAGTTTSPAIRISYASPQQMSAALQEVLEDIDRSGSGNNDGTTSVLLLGRYRRLRPRNLLWIEKSHPRLSISFRTIHASKGLEADHVVILGAEAGRLGFPSEIVDDPILDLVLPEPEKYHHAEERRVFYVALTRARKTVTILASPDRQSPFVRELVETPEYGVVELGGAAALVDHGCKACGGRLRLVRSDKSRPRFVCEHRFLCGTVQPACSACGHDKPARSTTYPDTVVCSCGSRFPLCPLCTDGWLIERKGRFGPFLGCVNYPRCKGRMSLNPSNYRNSPTSADYARR